MQTQIPQPLTVHRVLLPSAQLGQWPCSGVSVSAALGSPNLHCRHGPTGAEQRMDPSLHSSTQPTLGSAAFAISMHCWLLFRILSAGISKYFAERATLYLVCVQLISSQEVVLSLIQDPALAFVELHKLLPFSSLSRSLWVGADHSSHFGVTGSFLRMQPVPSSP